MCDMSAFSAVRTTGIYCCRGCSARPRRENVSGYLVAAAAEADGYRACFQCRPYRWPQTVSWTGPELVCRAVRLILNGALDGATEAELGARLGVSPRHLRRLFAETLGVTPDGLARSARAHFARRLLDDTDLSMLEIAHATGFGSVRQFNRACQKIFRASPRALRAKRRNADRLVADGGLPLRLSFLGPLDWDAVVRYLAAHAVPGVESIDLDAGMYRRTIEVNREAGLMELERGGDDHLRLTLHLPHWEELTHLVARARAIASLDLDLEEPGAHLRADSMIGPLLQGRPGLRPPGAWDAFEIGVRTIVGQHLSVAAANTFTGRLVEQTGMPAPGLEALGLTHLFPAAATLAEADLSRVGLTQARQAAIRAFACAVVEGRVRLDRSVGLDELIESITALEGLATETAQYLAFRLGEPDAFPAIDIGFRRALGRGAPRLGSLEAQSVSWRPWRALAATHLWAAAESGHVSRQTAA
jgi:AraC family transcriptional regulator, regulatory protein of adaptative response / DNA-3-methyladenine glycosylase II